MITHQEQLSLFTLISRHLKRNITCTAFGGTAMMFYGYKEETKDIDLLFDTDEEKKDFIAAIQKIGFEETSLVKIYIPEKLRDPHKPVMFKRGDSGRFDIFTKQIFHTVTSPQMKEDMYAVHEFRGEYTLTINVLRREHIVLLKGITEREKDMEDIITIIKKTKDFNWEYFIEEVLWQYRNGDKWVLFDTERTLRELKKYIFIEKKYLDKIYEALEENRKGKSK